VLRRGEVLATRAALYARVCTSDQSTELQLESLRAYAAARGWAVTEFADHGVSGAKEKRPALDALVGAARARRIDVVVAVRLDRLARSTHHLLSLAREFEALGVGLVITSQSIDTTTPTGRLLFTVLGAIAEFERELIRERVIAGVRRAKALGIRCGRPRKYELKIAEVAALRAEGLSLSEIGRRLGGERPIDPTVIRRLLAADKSLRRAPHIPAVLTASAAIAGA
jgi:DNA invertase Pin-like site-specific DNA recombinase